MKLETTKKIGLVAIETNFCHFYSNFLQDEQESTSTRANLERIIMTGGCVHLTDLFLFDCKPNWLSLKASYKLWIGRQLHSIPSTPFTVNITICTIFVINLAPPIHFFSNTENKTFLECLQFHYIIRCMQQWF